MSNTCKHVGEQLKKARVEKGIDLATLSKEVCISKKFIVAIEEDIKEDLPEKPYVLGFIRTISAQIGMERDATVEAYKAALVFEKTMQEEQTTGNGNIINKVVETISDTAENKSDYSFDNAQNNNLNQNESQKKSTDNEAPEENSVQYIEIGGKKFNKATFIPLCVIGVFLTLGILSSVFENKSSTQTENTQNEIVEVVEEVAEKKEVKKSSTSKSTKKDEKKVALFGISKAFKVINIKSYKPTNKENIEIFATSKNDVIVFKNDILQEKISIDKNKSLKIKNDKNIVIISSNFEELVFVFDNLVHPKRIDKSKIKDDILSMNTSDIFKILTK